MERRPEPPDPDLAGLRRTVEELAALERGPTSPGEAEAARRLRALLEARGCAVEVDEEPAWPAYAPTLAGLSAVAAGAALLARRRRRASGRRHPFAALAAAVAGALVADDVSNGPRIARRLHARRGTTTNVVATAGDATAPRTLLVLAHHDAAPTGLVFHPGPSRVLGERFPGIVARTDTGLPMWWPTFGGALLAAVGAATGARRTTAAGALVSVVSTVLLGDIARGRIVPGANDNLTAVAVLVHLAERLQAQPAAGLRVLLVSCGAEESLQEGVRALARRRLGALDPAATWVLNLDTVGSPHLVLLEGEGPFVMEDYCDPAFRDRVAGIAEAGGIALRRGLRARTSTDSVITSRLGLPTATLVSVDDNKALSNYHWPTDVPAEVDWSTVAAAAGVAELLLRSLAGGDVAPPALEG